MKKAVILLLLVLNISFYSFAQREQDSLTLVTLYNSTNGANWTNKFNWLSSNPINTWYGVTLTNGRVTGLSLRYSQLTGSILSEIGNLTNLQTLDLASNHLSGSIPSQIGNLTNLQHLYLKNNQLTGSIPSQIGNLVNLIDLDLDYNQLSGSIPSQIGNLINIQYLYLYHNQLTGSIPAEIGNLINLAVLALEYNYLTGSIPSQIGNLINLQLLYLEINQLTGSIPSQIGNLINLRRLDLSQNLLTGTIPLQIENPTNLTQLNLEYNKFTFSDIKPFLLVNHLDEFVYGFQDSLGVSIDTLCTKGSNITFTAIESTAGDIYQWYKNGALISSGTNKTYSSTNIQQTDAGKYYCAITNYSVPDLTLYIRKITLNVSFSTGIQENSLSGIKIYPNPTTGDIFIDIGNSDLKSAYTLTVLNMKGQIIYETKVNQQLYNLNLSSKVDKGVYFIQIKDIPAIEKVVQKIILQ